MNNYCLEVVERNSHLRQFEDDLPIGFIDCEEDYLQDVDEDQCMVDGEVKN